MSPGLPAGPPPSRPSSPAEEHADIVQNSYARTTVDSAYTMVIDGQLLNRSWASSRLISLSRIQQHIERETHVPVTHEMLLLAEPQRTKHQKRSWKSYVESVSRCVAGYHHAFGASEHEECRSIQGDICAYAHTLRRGLPSSVDVTQFLVASSRHYKPCVEHGFAQNNRPVA